MLKQYGTALQFGRKQRVVELPNIFGSSRMFLTKHPFCLTLVARLNSEEFSSLAP